MGGATLREPYQGGSQLAVPFPSGADDQPGPEPVDDQPGPEPVDDQGDDGGGGGEDGSGGPDSSRSSSPRGWGRRLAAPRANDVSGALFAVIAWSWIVLPLVQGGPAQVRDVWRAKWLNKDSEGKWLG